VCRAIDLGCKGLGFTGLRVGSRFQGVEFRVNELGCKGRGFRGWECTSVNMVCANVVYVQETSPSSTAVEGSGSRVQGSGFRVESFRYRSLGLGFTVQGLGFRV